MAYVVLDLRSGSILHEAVTRALCNQYLLNTFVKRGQRANAPSVFDCPYKILIANKDELFSKNKGAKPQAKITYKCYNYGILECTGTPEHIARELGVSLEDIKLSLKIKGRIRKGPLEGYRFERDTEKMMSNER